MRVVGPAMAAVNADGKADLAKRRGALGEKEGAGYDLANYRDAPAGLRIWGGAPVEAKDVSLLTQWIDWAFAETKASLLKAARASFLNLAPLAGGSRVASAVPSIVRVKPGEGGFPESGSFARATPP